MQLADLRPDAVRPRVHEDRRALPPRRSSSSRRAASRSRSSSSASCACLPLGAVRRESVGDEEEQEEGASLSVGTDAANGTLRARLRTRDETLVDVGEDVRAGGVVWHDTACVGALGASLGVQPLLDVDWVSHG